MGKEAICVIDRSDLVSMLSELYEGRFDGREVDSHAATQILGISRSTLDRWIDRKLIRVNNSTGGKRVERKFDLAYLFSLDIKTIKQQYRMLNK